MSPECFFVLDHYNDYISGELDTVKADRVLKHMKTCPNCDVFLGRAAAIHGRTVELLRIPAPPALRKSISSLMEKA
jgi:ribosomal protein S27AE